jgi:hypothetical protein
MPNAASKVQDNVVGSGASGSLDESDSIAQQSLGMAVLISIFMRTRIKEGPDVFFVLYLSGFQSAKRSFHDSEHSPAPRSP